MKTNLFLLFQVAIWTGLWAAMALPAKEVNVPVEFFLLSIFRIVFFAAFFNVVYYWALPHYFQGRKKRFYGLTASAFLVFVLSMVSMDVKFGFPGLPVDKNWASKRPGNRPSSVIPATPPPGLTVLPTTRPLAFSLIPTLLFGLLLVAAGATLRGFSEFEKKKREEEEANRSRLEAELALLKSQINPHFLLNTLNNIYVLSLTTPGKTPSALLKLSEMVNYLLFEGAQARISLQQDLEFIRNYISLQKLRLPPNVSVQFNEPSGEVHGVIEPMILISFIENAFKHGLTTREPCQIDISIQIEHQTLHLEVIRVVVT